MRITCDELPVMVNLFCTFKNTETQDRSRRSGVQPVILAVVLGV